MRDTMDKIVTSYFNAITSERFEYKGHIYIPKALIVKPSLLQPIKCILGCGACCSCFSLDYLPSEKQPNNVKARRVKLNGVNYEIISDTQVENKEHHCKYVSKEDGYSYS